MNTFLFILMFVVSVAVTAVFLNEMKCNIKGTDRSENKLKGIRSIARGTAILLIFIALAEILGIIKCETYDGSFTLLGATAGLSFLLCTLNKKKKYHAAITAVKAMLLASILEVTLFNIPTFRMWFGSYGEMSFSADEIASDGADVRPENGDIAVIGDRTTIFTFEGLNEEITDVYVDAEFGGGTKAAEISIDATDETRPNTYRELIAQSTLVKGKPHSGYTQLHLSGNVNDLKVSVMPLDSGMVYIKGISFNRQIPMDISWARFLLIIFGICSWHLMMNILSIMERKGGDQMTQELVEAFEHGSTHLLDAPKEELNNFAYPYDTDALGEADIPYNWDHVYYEQQYYSYYGIAPVVLVFLPYHLITGYYFPDSMAVLLFAVIGIIGLTKLYMEFMRKLFPKTPAGLVISGLILIQTVSGVWFSIGRPRFYEIALSAGFATLTWAVYFMFKANIVGTGKISLKYTTISSLIFAIAVLCRPTLVLYCITAALFMICALPRVSATEKKVQRRRYTLPAMCSPANGLYRSCTDVVQLRPFRLAVRVRYTVFTDHQ